jgi:hypothetical protein
MGVLIISIPIPSLIGTMLNRVQTERMKRTDSRVQSITECKKFPKQDNFTSDVWIVMNVLRMIKLFAWETRVKQKVLEKREDELLWTKKRQLLQLLNMNAK